jgi:hypothetical protein
LTSIILLVKRDGGVVILREEFKALFYKLTEMPYKAHWFSRVSTEKVLSGVPSDCSDRTYVLVDWCLNNNITYSFILTIFTKPQIGLHIALVIDGMVYDPIWKLYEITVNDYKRILNGTFSQGVGSWIQKIIP